MTLYQGYNLKLLKDSHVFVLGFKKSVPLRTLVQMVGREIRSRGVVVETYFTL